MRDFRTNCGGRCNNGHVQRALDIYLLGNVCRLGLATSSAYVGPKIKVLVELSGQRTRPENWINLG